MSRCGQAPVVITGKTRHRRRQLLGRRRDGAEVRDVATSWAVILMGMALLAVVGWVGVGDRDRQVGAQTAPAEATAPGGRPRWVVVQPGDTLWELAERLGPPGADPRDGVQVLRQINHLALHEPLRPGQAIRVPATWDSGAALSRAGGAAAP